MTARIESPPVLTLPKNERGRDLVTGDVHGSIDLVFRALDRANFDQSVDRFFIPGDLIDRGPDSARCVELLRFAFACRGNHDDMLLDLLEKGEGDVDPAMKAFLRARNWNGMAWIAEATPEVLQDVADAVRKLPIVIEADTDRGKVGFVHADVPKGMHWDEFVQKIREQDPAVMDIAIGAVDASRDRINSNDQSGVPGIGRIFVGHTVQWDGIRRFGNVWAIDTGSTFAEIGKNNRGHLTLANASMRTVDLAAPPALTRALDLRDPAFIPAVPFGLSGLGCSMKRIKP